jgi:hypothetical protein
MNDDYIQHFTVGSDGLLRKEKMSKQQKATYESYLPKVYKQYKHLLRVTTRGRINKFSVQDIYNKEFDITISVSTASVLAQKLMHMYPNIVEELQKADE